MRISSLVPVAVIGLLATACQPSESVSVTGKFLESWQPQPHPEDAAMYKNIDIEGTVGCLPHKPDKFDYQDCVVGVKSIDTHYYALDLDLLNATARLPASQNDKVEITGKFVPDDGSDPIHDIIGTIKVGSVTRISKFTK